MKSLFLILVVMLLALSVKAQTFNDYQGVVSSSPIGNVVINNYAGVKTQIPNDRNTIRGYSVRIFFDNSQNARSDSQEILEKFEKMYPETVVLNEYTAPYFKVTAGNFLTHEEAIVLLGNISNEFPNAFVVNKSIPLKDFTNSKVLGEITMEEVADSVANTGIEVESTVVL